MADVLYFLVLVLIVPAAWFCGWLCAKAALSQPRRDVAAMRRRAVIAERTRVLAAKHGGNWPPNGEHIW